MRLLLNDKLDILHIRAVVPNHVFFIGNVDCKSVRAGLNRTERNELGKTYRIAQAYGVCEKAVVIADEKLTRIVGVIEPQKLFDG